MRLIDRSKFIFVPKNNVFIIQFFDILIFIVTQRELKIPLIDKFQIVSISGISIRSSRFMKYSSLCKIENGIK